MITLGILHRGSKKTIVLILGVASAIILLAGPIFAQTANGRISGTVKDQTGGTIVGAVVVVTDVARGLTRNLTTDDAGAYLAPNLLPGNYTVRSTFTGFQAWERTNIVLAVGGDVFIDVTLVPGAQTQTVTITEELPLVNTTSASLGGVLTNQTINDLPLNGRNFTLLLELRPGVVLSLGNDSGGAGAASANGLRAENSNEYVVEGLHGMSPFNGQPVMNSLALRGDAATLLPVDAIQEFNQQFNTKAEYGYRAGGAINIGLKSGTNALHGTGYAFFRRDEFDARNYFIPPALDKTNTNLNQFGMTLGGPIKKDKLFFFIGGEGQLLNVGDPVRSSAPFTDPSMLSCTGQGTAALACTPIANSVAGNRTPDATNHLILACLSLPAAGRSPQSLALVSLDANCNRLSTYPNSLTGASWIQPHGGSDHGAPADVKLPITSYYSNLQSEVRTLGSVAKIDYALNNKNSVNGFLFVGNGDNVYSANKTSPDWRTNVLARSYMVAGTWTYLPGAAWANALRVGYASLAHRYVGVDAASGVTSASLGLKTGVNTFLEGGENAGFPQSLGINGFTARGSRNTEVEGPNRSVEINNTLSYLAGDHALRFGGTIMFQEQNGGTWANTRGTFSFGQGSSSDGASNGLLAFLNGQLGYSDNIGDGLNNICPKPGVVTGVAPNQVCVGAPVIRRASGNTGLQTAVLFYGNPESHLRRNVYSLFLQDDWRIHSRLTLNLGVRYDVNSVLHDRDYILGTFDPNAGIVQEGNQVPYVMGPDRNDFVPRVGFAWDVRGNGKTVVRAGGSIIHELVILRTFTEIGNDFGLAGNPTAWVIGCSAPVTGTIPAGARTNCPGALLTSGGSRNVGGVEWSRSNGTLAGIVNWDGPITGATPSVFPSTNAQTAILTCSSDIRVRDSESTAGVVSGRPGVPCPIVTSDPHLRTPYVETWTLSVQHALTNNVVVDMAYVGNHGTKLISHTDFNQPPSLVLWNQPNPGSPGQTFAQTCNLTRDPDDCDGSALGDAGVIVANKPFTSKFPYIDTITILGNRETSNYNGLQVSLTARNFRGFSMVSGYTFSKALDVASSNGADVGSDSYNVGLDYGRADSDLRHRLTLAPSFVFPSVMGHRGLLSGWRITGNFKYQTGRAWNADPLNDSGGIGYDSRWDFSGVPGDFEVDYTGVNRATFHPGGASPSGTNPQSGLLYKTSDLAINTGLCTQSSRSIATLQAFGCWTQGGSAITPPPVGSFGTMTRGLFDGPSFFGLDMSLSKTQKLTERFSAELRAEMFNILNHPAFAQPETDLGCEAGSCSFGLTSATPDVSATNPVLGSGGSRRMQFGVKLIF